MPIDIESAVRKYIPSNPKLHRVVARVLMSEFQVRSLPDDAVKMVVRRAFEFERDLDVDTDSSIFKAKLTEYVVAIKPRFLAKINQLRQQRAKQGKW